MFISNWDLRETVKRAADRTVFDAVHEAVHQAVSRAVHGSWPGDVYWALQQDPDPTAIQDFLHEVQVGR